ncbi:MAG: GNAT family N-acetyltransferase [Promethearchaeota archaeon]
MANSRLNLKRRRIRSFFLLADKAETTREKLQNELETKGLTYIQMKLPVAEITAELEKKLKEKVEKNILNAKIREAREEDLESIRDIHNRAWMTAGEPFRPVTLDTIKKIYDHPDTQILIAKVYGTDAGFIILDFEGENKEIGVIAGLGVLPRFQRKGLGTVIGMAAWNYFKEKGVKELRCEVHVDNKVSYNFIKSIGFREYDRKTYTRDDFLIEEDDD